MAARITLEPCATHWAAGTTMPPPSADHWSWYETLNIGTLTATSVTGADGVDAPEVPAAFVAVAVNAYAMPVARPVTSQDQGAPVTVHVVGGVVAGVRVTV